MCRKPWKVNVLWNERIWCDTVRLGVTVGTIGLRWVDPSHFFWNCYVWQRTRNEVALDGVVWHPKHYPEVIEHFKTYWSKETEELEGLSLLLYSASTDSRLPIRCVSRAFDALGLLAAYCHSSSWRADTSTHGFAICGFIFFLLFSISEREREREQG